MDDAPSPPPVPASVSRHIAIPSPEDLGLTSARAAGADWDALHRRLQVLGADYRLQKLPQGGCRFICLLPTAHADRSHRIEAEAATDVGAVRLALERAELWASRR